MNEYNVPGYLETILNLHEATNISTEQIQSYLQTDVKQPTWQFRMHEWKLMACLVVDFGSLEKLKCVLKLLLFNFYFSLSVIDKHFMEIDCGFKLHKISRFIRWSSCHTVLP